MFSYSYERDLAYISRDVTSYYRGEGGGVSHNIASISGRRCEYVSEYMRGNVRAVCANVRTKVSERFVVTFVTDNIT